MKTLELVGPDLIAANDDHPATTDNPGFIRRIEHQSIECGPEAIFGNVTWRTLISADRTPSSDFILGIAEFPPAGILKLHRHTPPEFYLCLSGSGVVTVDGHEHEFATGAAVFIPGDAEHGVTAGPTGLSFAYGFAQQAFSDVEYVFSDRVENHARVESNNQ